LLFWNNFTGLFEPSNRKPIAARLQGEEDEFLEDVEMPTQGGCAATTCFALVLLLSLLWFLSK